MYSALLSAWESGTVIQSWKDAIIALLWKQKGSKADLSKYRTLALLVTSGKVMSRLLLNRMQLHAETHILAESQYGFRPTRQTTDLVATLRRM